MLHIDSGVASVVSQPALYGQGLAGDTDTHNVPPRPNRWPPRVVFRDGEGGAWGYAQEYNGIWKIELGQFCDVSGSQSYVEAWWWPDEEWAR